MKHGPENNIINSSTLITSDESPLLECSYDLDQPVRHLVFTRLNNPALISFSEVCKKTTQWTKDEREIREASLLVEFVVKGNQDQAERMLQCNPGLLLSTQGEAIDYSGKYIKGLTAFQAALCAGDVEMCMMMKEYFNTAENEVELLKQYNIIFPQGIEAYSQEQANMTFDFSDIIEAIMNAQDDEVKDALNKEFDDSKALHKALSTFRKEFDTLSHQTQVFNPWHLHKAFTLYDENFVTMQSWNKRDLLWRQVVGYTQRHLPACYAQALAQGLYYLAEQKEPLRRGFDFRRGGGAIFPTRPFVDLGFDFAAEVGVRCGTRGCWEWGDAPAAFGEIISSKNIKLGAELFSPPRNHNSWCVVS